MVRTPCCRAEGLKKGAWTPEEDKKLVDYVNRHGEGGWRTLPDKAGLKRCGKSCRLRWANYLRPDIKRGEFTQDEEDSIIKLHAIHGNKWSAIARRLPGRTDNEIKNHWNTHIKKRLIKKGIDPLTHEPLSGDTDKPDTPEKSDLRGDDDQKLDNNKSLRSSSAKFLNRVANKFGQKINQSVMSDIIGSGGPLISHTCSITTPLGCSESEKSTTPMSSSTFTSNDPLIYSDIVGDIDGFTSKFLSDVVVSRDDEDFVMLDDESCVENTLFMRELSMILQEDNSQSNTMSFDDDIDFKMINQVVDHCDSFEEVDNYFGEYINLVN